MPVDMHPGGWAASDYQGAWGWFFGFKENSEVPKGGFHLMTCEKPGAKSIRDARWMAGAGDGAAILCHRGLQTPSPLHDATTFVWHEGRIPMCRWISPRDGEVFIKYSLVETGDLPKVVPVSLTVSGKDVEMSDRSVPTMVPEQPAFHREVLRKLYWFGVKVRKGSVLDFSLDFPGRDLATRHGEITVRIGLQPVEFNAFSGEYEAAEQAKRERELERERRPLKGEPAQPEAQESEKQLAKEAQADAEPLRLLAHKTYQFARMRALGDTGRADETQLQSDPLKAGLQISSILKINLTLSGSAPDKVSGKEKAQEENGLEIEQEPPLPLHGPIMCL